VHIGEQLLVLGVLFVIAYVLGRLGKLIGLPAIPIYMLVGLLASPSTGWFPLDFEAADVELVAVFGLILLLFNLGLEFDQDAFFGNVTALLISGGSRIIINFGIGFLFGLWVGWGTREALIIAGMTATSSSAIVTKLLIELRRLANPETPAILGITVVEDVFIALYLAIVTVIIGGETDAWRIVAELSISFAFLIAMFALARWGGRFVSRLIATKDDELFTILFFGLAVAFGGIGEMLGISSAIGAFLIGLVLGATRFRVRIEQLALPMRDVFGAFFFLNFGLALDVSTFWRRALAGSRCRRHDSRHQHARWATDREAQQAHACRGRQRQRNVAEPRRVRADSRYPCRGGRTRRAANALRGTVRSLDGGDRPSACRELREARGGTVPREESGRAGT